MPAYLMVLNIGPVQGFIATARRTRDLWFGSHVLSEVSKAAASCLLAAGAKLIFPNPVNSSVDLKTGSCFTVANRVLAEVNDNDPVQYLDEAQGAAQTCWRDFCQQALQNIQPNQLSRVIRDTLWNAQRDDVLEFSWVWVEIHNGDYKGAYDRLKRLEAARKTTRLFNAAAISSDAAPGFGLPKSSLDGMRETVLQQQLSRKLRRKLGLGEGEQLDCPGLVKRLGGSPDQFTPVSRIALDPWLGQITPSKLSEVTEAYDMLVRLNDAGLATRVTGNNGIYQALPYDGQLLYPSRLEVAWRDAKNEEEPDQSLLRDALDQLRKAVRPLWNEFGEPCPYVCLLQADGDHMGALIDKAETADQHQAISRCLAEFAAEVPQIVRDYRGHCIYSGGDDVLALAPLDKNILACAYALHESFSQHLRPIALTLEARPPTLSVGIGIQHAIEPLSHLRALAKRAEKGAKGDDGFPKAQQRDSLCIIVQTRSGADIVFRDRWENMPHQSLGDWIDLYLADQLSDKAAYDLRLAARQLTWAADESRRQVFKAEARRILTRKRSEGGTRELAPEHLKALTDCAQNRGLEILANELIISRWLAQRVHT